MRISVNPEMLTLAREIRGLTQSKLAEISNIRQAKISRYEGGVTDVSADALSVLAESLAFPEDFFFQEGRRYGADSSELFNRRRRSVRTRDLRRINGLVNLYRIGSRQLLKAFEPKPSSFVPSITLEDFNDVSEIAAAVRSMWNMPPGPVNNLIGWLENASCLVFSCDFKNEKIDEVVQWIPPDPPIVLVNSSAPADRTRFSLAHALGHLVMHLREEPYKDMEKEADLFAAAFLMPEYDIKDELAPVTINHMLELKQYWKCSMASLMYRSKTLGVITERQYTSLCQQLSRLGYRKNEPFPIPRETPQTVKRLLDSHKHHLDYSDEELAKLLKVRIEYYYKWYYPKKIIEFPSNESQFRLRHDSGTSWNM